jgi:Pyruvate/2-oxoacid:ferredoxin oxidoreductase gamma subunit
VGVARTPLDSPLVAEPNLLVAMNEPSLRKFDANVQAGGWVIYNGEEFPADCARDDVHVLARNFTEIAHELGDARAANMVMLGALLAIAGKLPQASIGTALRRLVKNPKWVELDERALERGSALAREAQMEVSCAVCG